MNRSDKLSYVLLLLGAVFVGSMFGCSASDDETGTSGDSSKSSTSKVIIKDGQESYNLSEDSTTIHHIDQEMLDGTAGIQSCIEDARSCFSLLTAPLVTEWTPRLQCLETLNGSLRKSLLQFEC